jgi:hypothetical protein
MKQILQLQFERAMRLARICKRTNRFGLITSEIFDAMIENDECDRDIQEFSTRGGEDR